MMTYEQSVQWIREQPEYASLVELCYLDTDNFAAARRFQFSEEFSAISKFLNLAILLKESKILDLSCGNGIASFAFASLGYNVISVDPNLNDDVGLGAVQRLAKLVSPPGSIETVEAFAESLPFVDECFDRVYIRQGAHHFSDLKRGFAECFRVLKPAGKLLVSREHVVDNETQLQEFLANHILHKLHGGENAHPLTRYKSSLRHAGFHQIKILSPYDSVINHFPASNADIHRGMSDWLNTKLGKHLGSTISQLPLAEKAYRKLLSLRDRSPGRPYSFLCTK
jgi:SAM-dependent methyltransferase